MKPKIIEGEFTVTATEMVKVEPLKQQIPSMVKKANAIQVRDAKTYKGAGEVLVSVKGLIAQIEEAFAIPKKKAHEAHKAITALEKSLLAGPMEARRLLDNKMSDWRDEQEKARRAEAESMRLQMEEEAKENQKLHAEALKRQGKTKEAKALLKEEIYIETPEIASNVPKVEGLAVRTNWTFDILDEFLIPREYLMVDTVKINKVVRALQGQTNIPGIKVREETLTVGRA